jgi:hypothetical protein
VTDDLDEDSEQGDDEESEHREPQDERELVRLVEELERRRHREGRALPVGGRHTDNAWGWRGWDGRGGVGGGRRPGGERVSCGLGRGAVAVGCHVAGGGRAGRNDRHERAAERLLVSAPAERELVGARLERPAGDPSVEAVAVRSGLPAQRESAGERAAGSRPTHDEDQLRGLREPEAEDGRAAVPAAVREAVA